LSSFDIMTSVQVKVIGNAIQVLFGGQMLCVAAGLRRLMSAQTLDVIPDDGETILAYMQLCF